MLRITGYVVGALLTGTVAAAAQGTCPTGDGRDGVWLDFADRSVLTRVRSDGQIEEMEFAHDGSYVYLYRTLPIGLVVESWSLEAGYAGRDDRETVSYAGTPDPVPAPAAGVRYDGMETSRFGDGSDARSAVNVVVGDARAVSIGGCSYTGLPIDVTRVDLAGGLAQRDSMMHLAELGLTIFLGFSEGDEQPESVLPLSISSDPPVAGGAAPGVAPPPLPDAAQDK